MSALSTAALVFYARPFKQNPEVKLDKRILPKEFAEFHEDLILYRDKVVAHRDVKGPKTPWGTANDVTFHYSGSSVEFETSSPILEPGAVTKLISLTAMLAHRMDEALEPLVVRYVPASVPAGRYTLALKHGDVEWLKKQPD